MSMSLSTSLATRRYTGLTNEEKKVRRHFQFLTKMLTASQVFRHEELQFTPTSHPELIFSFRTSSCSYDRACARGIFSYITYLDIKSFGKRLGTIALHLALECHASLANSFGVLTTSQWAVIVSTPASAFHTNGRARKAIFQME
jgi:hypothetical protein